MVVSLGIPIFRVFTVLSNRGTITVINKGGDHLNILNTAAFLVVE